MSDIGRTFVVSRSQSLVVTLTESDVEDQLSAGDTAEESAYIIATCSPESSWTTDDIQVEDVSAKPDNVIEMRRT